MKNNSFDENCIHIFNCQIPDDLSNINYHTLISFLPQYEQDRILSVQNPESQLRTLYGRIMFRKILSKFNIDELSLIETTTTGKPFLPMYSFIKFNISHAGELVVCAITKD